MISYGNGKQGAPISRRQQRLVEQSPKPEPVEEEPFTAFIDGYKYVLIDPATWANDAKRGKKPVIIDELRIEPSISRAAIYLGVSIRSLGYWLQKGTIEVNGHTARFFGEGE